MPPSPTHTNPTKKQTNRKTDQNLLLLPGKYKKSLNTLAKKWKIGEGAFRGIKNENSK